jgi:ATP-binding cassette subfamily B protein
LLSQAANGQGNIQQKLGPYWWRCFLPILRPYYKALAAAGVAMIMDSALTVMRPWPLKVVIDRVLSHRATRVPFLRAWLDATTLSRMQFLWGACAVTFLIALGTGISTYYFTRTLGSVGPRFAFDLRRHLFAHMQRLSLRFHDRQPLGDLIHRITSDTNAIQDALMNSVQIIGSNLFLLAGMITLMVWLNWRFALAALSVAPILFVVVLRYRSRIKYAARQARISTGRMASLAQETLASIRIVQGLAQEGKRDELFEERGVSSLQASLEAVRYQARVAPLIDLLAATGLILVMWYGATRVMAGDLSTGDVVVFFAYVTSLYTPLRALARFSNVSNKAIVSAERIAEVLSVRSDIVDRKGARDCPRSFGSIEFRDISFEYSPGHPVLSHVELTVKPGEKIALVGATGAGKSTFVSLIPRFYDPTRGAVLIDGEDIRNYSLHSLREQISLVLQDSLLFGGTIRDNISFGRPEASHEEVVAAAVTANADEFIRRLPGGYDAPVSERGSTLSGGQRQRIAIARAVLRSVPILILDEPTTSLDAVAEATVIDALERAAVGRTTFMIAHRLNTIRFADRILVFDDGRIVEQGTHKQLLTLNGRYARLYQLQMSLRREVAIIPPGEWGNFDESKMSV